jgi:D-beta-D-heptose 7-phosphate kinase/D-beta-D-heptose 1-phosphate adenosyltransferase
MTYWKNTQQLKKFKIFLIGDSCIDEYIFGAVERLSPEAPIPILHQKSVDIRQGMALNVKLNLEALGCKVDFETNKERIIKRRYIDNKSGYQLLRVDEEPEVLPWNGLIPENLNDMDAVVVSDYNKGFLTYELIESLISKFNGPIFVDTKKTDLSRFKNCYLKINELEYNRRSSENPMTIITMGSKGARFCDILYETSNVEVFDGCGAGDTFLSALTYRYLETKSIDLSIKFANIASSITVQHFGNYCPSLKEIIS